MVNIIKVLFLVVSVFVLSFCAGGESGIGQDDINVGQNVKNETNVTFDPYRGVIINDDGYTGDPDTNPITGDPAPSTCELCNTVGCGLV